MTSDIENLLANLRDPRPGDPPTPDRKRIAIATGVLGLFSIVLTGGALAYGMAGTLAAPLSAGDSRGVELPWSIEKTSAPEAAPPATPTIAPSTPAAGADSPTFDLATDVDTIPIPADFPPEEVANARLWLSQQSIVARCMDEKGFHFTFTAWWLRDSEMAMRPGAGEGPGTAFWVALWGKDDQPFGDDYDWAQAGCQGYAVHATGMDGAH